MKKILTFLLLVAALSPSAAQTSDETLLIDLETKLTQAIAQHDESFLTNLFDEKYQGVTPAGVVVDKAKWLELLRTNNLYVIFSTSNVRSSLHGITAVVTGKLEGKSKTGALIGSSRFIHVFVKRSEGWKIIDEQSTVIIQP